MSAITYLTNIVTSLTNRFNQLESNSKKVDELPAQTTLEPSSKIPVSRAGESEHITVQQIISSIQNSNYNQLTSIGDITVNEIDNEIIVEPVSGQINGNNYATSTDTTIPIILCPSGFNRKDILVLTTSNTVIAISGEETDGAIIIAPPIPLDAIYITEFDVSDSVIGVATPPIVGTQFKQKNESRKFSATASGTDYAVELRTAGHQHYAVSGTVTSVAGFSKALITASPSAEVPYVGKDYFFENETDHNVTLKDAFSSIDIPFSFGADLVVPSNGIVWLKYNAAPDRMELFFKSWSEVDLSTKADLVGGKVPSSQLPSYVDDVLEYANLVAFPVTGETGKIYIALDTNKSYRWSGSAYVQIGGGANTQIFHWWGGNWVTTTLNNYYYIGYNSAAVEGLNNTISVSMNGRNKGLFIAPFNCKIKRVIFKEGGSGTYTGAFVLASGLPNYGGAWINGYSNVVTHLNSTITSSGSNQNKFEFLVTDNITIPKGYAVCPMLVFSAQGSATKVGVEISIEIEEVV